MKTTAIKLLQGIDTIIIRVSHIEASKQWYMEKLGLGMLFEAIDMKLVVLDTNSPTSLTLWQTDQTISVNKGTASYPIFRTPDAEALRTQLLERGIKTGDVIQDNYVRYFFFYDPDGNILEACQVHE